MASKEETVDSKPAPRSKRLSMVAGELTKEAAVDASPGPLTPRRSARLSGSFPSPALDSLVLPARRRRSSSSTSMTEEVKVAKPRLKTTEVPEKIEEEVVILDDDTVQKEESTPRKRTRLCRRQSELMDNDNTVGSPSKIRETRSRRTSGMEEITIVNEEPASLQTRTRRGRRLSELMETNSAVVESPSKTRATRSRKVSDIEEVLIIDEDPVQEEGASPPKRTRLGRRQSELLQNENVVNSPSQSRTTKSRKILDIKEEAVVSVSAGASSPVKENSCEKSAAIQPELSASPPVKIALTKPKKSEEIVPEIAQLEVEESQVRREDKNVDDLVPENSQSENVEDLVPENSQSKIEKTPIKTDVQSNQKTADNIHHKGQSEVTKSPVKIDLPTTKDAEEENGTSDASPEIDEEGKQKLPITATIVAAGDNASKEDCNLCTVETEDLMEVEENDLANKNVTEPTGEKEEANDEDGQICNKNSVKSPISKESVEAEEAVKEVNSVESAEVVCSTEKTSAGGKDAVVCDSVDTIVVPKNEVVPKHIEIDSNLVVEGVEEPEIAGEARQETKDAPSEDMLTIKDQATPTDEIESSKVDPECAPTKSSVEQTSTKKTIEDGMSCDAAIVEAEENVAGELAVITTEDKEIKTSPKTLNEIVVSSVTRVEAKTKTDIYPISSATVEKEDDFDVFDEDSEVVKTILAKASVGEEDDEDQSEAAADVDQNQVTFEPAQEEEGAEAAQVEKVVEAAQKEEAIEAAQMEEVVKATQKEEANEKSDLGLSAMVTVETPLEQVLTSAETNETYKDSQTEDAVQSNVSAPAEIDQSSVKVISREESSNEEKCIQDEDEEMVEIIEKTLLENESKKREATCESPKKRSKDFEASTDKKNENDVEMAVPNIEPKTETEAEQDVKVKVSEDDQKPEVFASKPAIPETEEVSDEKENANSGHKNCEPGTSRPNSAKPGPSKGGAMKKSQDMLLGRRESGRFWKSDRDRFRSVIKSRGLKTSFKQRKEQKETLKRVKEMEQNLKDEMQRQREELKARQEANKKKREENERRTEIVQEIKNPAKIKRMKKKQVRLLEKRDTTVVQKHP